jgi:hypothetical protein
MPKFWMMIKYPSEDRLLEVVEEHVDNVAARKSLEARLERKLRHHYVMGYCEVSDVTPTGNVVKAPPPKPTTKRKK